MSDGAKPTGAAIIARKTLPLKIAVRTADEIALSSASTARESW